MPMSDLEALLERVEKASGPDRELDAAIMCATLGTTSTADDLIYHKVPHCLDECAPGTYWRKSRSGKSLRTAPLLTASLDAALSLVEEKLPYQWVRLDHWTDINIARPSASILPTSASILPKADEPTDAFASYGATLPLALLAALLRALIAQEAKADV